MLKRSREVEPAAERKRSRAEGSVPASEHIGSSSSSSTASDVVAVTSGVRVESVAEVKSAVAAATAAGKKPLLIIVPDSCQCSSSWRVAFGAERCVTGAVKFHREVERHHYAKRTQKGKKVPDVAAANRFAAYGALAAIVHGAGTIFLC